MTFLDSIITAEKALTLAGVPEGMDALVLADSARAAAQKGRPILHIARDDTRMQALTDALSFFAPEIEILAFPAWDCLPYDRVSPRHDVIAARIECLWRLAGRDNADTTTPLIVLTTVNAGLQRVPPAHNIRDAHFDIAPGTTLDMAELQAFLATNGYSRAGQVGEPGEFAVRGGLIDIFPPGAEQPVRIDLFGDDVDEMRTFDALSQRSGARIPSLTLMPAAEFALDEATTDRFRAGYLEAFGAVLDDDPLYEAVKAGRRHHGMEHWLPLFLDGMDTLFDAARDAIVTLDDLADDAAEARLAAIADYFSARKEALNMGAAGATFSSVYKPLSPERLYLTRDEWADALKARAVRRLTPFSEPESDTVIALGGKRGRDFAPERAQKKENIYDTLRLHIDGLRAAKKRVLFACYSLGARERLKTVLADHSITPIETAEGWAECQKLGSNTVALVVLPLETGFESSSLALITEQDVLGDRLIHKARKAKRAENFISEASALGAGDLVVHINHGVGRFEGLETLNVAGADHDCLKLVYAGGDRLYLPVENIEMLSRYGAGSPDGEGATLDKLGSHQWQKRHAKLKERIAEMAEALIKVAAQRELREAPGISPPEGMYEEFAARFPYVETEDQARAIRDVTGDLGRQRAMDRLVCGDVGFGKTEVALRAAFLAAFSGLQVAVVTPTTLLARQHMKTFSERFHGLPVNIGMLSRLVTPKETTRVKEGLKSGRVDIVIGTHALLAKNINFANLGLLIIDEEQHFGVGHKERLKQLRSDVHVLTLTATPIPRTLQMALSGLRDLSLIATAPVDRLAVRTFVMPFDEITVREALLREHYRGGQSFYVCPRISDLDEAAAYLRDHVPEVHFTVAHGRMTPNDLEDAMNAFYDGKAEVLLSTTIIESGLDIPTVNTMIVHRADMFGLAQLYQLRGRIGRSKVRAYAYMTVPSGRILTDAAHKRLEVLQALDTLGAGFSLASHDLDIRGAGNLLGEEQSGHVREVGVELYQQMLEEAVATARGDVASGEEQWSPQINLGATVLIPESYVGDLNLRMALYRRLGEMESGEEIEGFAAELIDRFGPVPDEVEQLLTVIRVKGYCRRAGIEKIDAGPKGATITFRDGTFANPAGLIDFITSQGSRAKVRPDHTLVYFEGWSDVKARLSGGTALARNLAKIAEASA